MRRFLSLFTLLIFSGILAFAQTRVVSGTITDNSGSPVAFATVTEAGTKNAVSTDASGNYTSIVNPSDHAADTKLVVESQTVYDITEHKRT